MDNQQPVSIPQAVGTVATVDAGENLLVYFTCVSIPQAVGTVATGKNSH